MAMIPPKLEPKFEPSLREREAEPGEHIRRFLTDCRARGYKPLPKEVLEVIYCDETLPVSTIKNAAEKAAQYVHPRLAVTGIIASDSFSERLERAIERCGPRLIEGRAERSDVSDE
jgi:hypothetical protein